MSDVVSVPLADIEWKKCNAVDDSGFRFVRSDYEWQFTERRGITEKDLLSLREYHTKRGESEIADALKNLAPQGKGSMVKVHRVQESRETICVVVARFFDDRWDLVIVSGLSSEKTSCNACFRYENPED